MQGQLFDVNADGSHDVDGTTIERVQRTEVV